MSMVRSKEETPSIGLVEGGIFQSRVPESQRLTVKSDRQQASVIIVPIRSNKRCFHGSLELEISQAEMEEEDIFFSNSFFDIFE